MTDVNALNGYTQTGTTNNTASQNLSADMNTFLTLLTTQLKYQDPLDPMDTAEFTNQLVQYSSVEQAIQTNEKLDSLLSMNIANLGAQAVSYIGKVAQVLGNVMPLEGGKAKATYTLDKNVVSTTIVVKDMNGNIVYSEQARLLRELTSLLGTVRIPTAISWRTAPIKSKSRPRLPAAKPQPASLPRSLGALPALPAIPRASMSVSAMPLPQALAIS